MTYSGNKIFNTNNLVLVALALFWGIIIIKAPHLKAVLISFLSLSPILLNALFDSFYFEITQDELIARNYLLPFIKEAYSLNEITEIRISSTRPYGLIGRERLRVVRGRYLSPGYKSASLRLKDWQGIVNNLADKRINVVIGESYLLDQIEIPQ